MPKLLQEVIIVAERKSTKSTKPRKTDSEKASFLTRLGAFILDLIIIGIIERIVGLAFGWPVASSRDTYGYNEIGVLSTLITIAYFTYLTVTKGATFGKMALKIQVVSAKTGKFLNWQEALMREFVGRLINSFTLGIGYLWALWDKENQGLHDKIAGSYVVKQK